MGVIIELRDFKCFNQLRNGEDFTLNLSEYTPNLVGNVGERLQVEYDLYLTWTANSSINDPWIVEPNRIRRSTGSFKDDGFIIGNRVDYINNWENRKFDTPYDYLETVLVITYISEDGKILEFTTTGSVSTLGKQENVGIWARSDFENLNVAILLKFGLLSNNEDFNFLSKVTGGQQVYYNREVSTSEEPMNPIGEESDWVTGSMAVTLFYPPTLRNQFGYHIKHQFILTPYYVVGELENLRNGILPDLLKGDNSLKYAFQSVLRQTLTNIPTSKSYIYDSLLGSVGGFGENFNGYNSLYQRNYISYVDEATNSLADGIILGEPTKIQFVISGKDRALGAGDRIGVYISYLPSSESEYQDTGDSTFVENFMYDSIVFNGLTLGTTRAGIITYYEAIPISGEIRVIIVVDYDTSQLLRLSNSSNYAIWAQIEDGSLIAGSSDRMPILLDVNNYQAGSFIEGLLDFDTIDFIGHNGFPVFTQWNEDGILVNFDFWLETSQDARLENIEFALIAENTITGNSFILDTYLIDTSGFPISSGTQQIEVDTSRGYVLPTDDEFNKVIIETGTLVGTKQHYVGKIAQKIKWQDWIPNEEADTVFYDKTKPQNNLNFKSSNYSNKQNYVIKVRATSNLTGKDSLGRSGKGFEQDYSTSIAIFDYGESNDVLTGVITTHDPVTLSDAGGQLLKDRDTLFRITWNSGIGADGYAIHRIQRSNSLGDDISEISSIRGGIVGDILKPLEGETFLKVTGNVTECLIDYTKIQEGVEYDYSGRIETTGGSVKLLADNTAKLLADGSYKLLSS